MVPAESRRIRAENQVPPSTIDARQTGRWSSVSRRSMVHPSTTSMDLNSPANTWITCRPKRATNCSRERRSVETGLLRIKIRLHAGSPQGFRGQQERHLRANQALWAYWPREDGCSHRTGAKSKEKRKARNAGAPSITNRNDLVRKGCLLSAGVGQVIRCAQKIRLINHTVSKPSTAVIRTPRAPRIRPATSPILATDFGKRR